MQPPIRKGFAFSLLMSALQVNYSFYRPMWLASLALGDSKAHWLVISAGAYSSTLLFSLSVPTSLFPPLLCLNKLPV